MTATDRGTEVGAKVAATAADSWHPRSVVERALLFGTGLGIAVGERDLEIAVVRARPGRPSLAGALLVRDFRTRPAAEWGSEVAAFLAASKDRKLAATVSIPRAETIVRSVHLPGVPEKDIRAAIELQLDTLHPYGDEEIAWAFLRTARTSVFAQGTVLVGLTRKTVLDSYETLFAEAGIPLAAITFSPATIYSALRLWSKTPAPALVSYLLDERGRAEVYGESDARPVYSAEFPLPLDRALAVARAELRLAPDTPAFLLREILPLPVGGSNDGASPLAYAAAAAGAVPRASKLANFLPKGRRAAHGRLQLLFTAVLAVLFASIAVVDNVVFPALDQRRYASDMNNEARKLEPTAARVRMLEAKAASDRVKTAALDQFHSRAQADLDVLSELTKLLPPPIWTSSIEIFPDSVVLVGEAEQAAPLLKLLDSSPLFQGSEFGLSVTRNGTSEAFRIRTLRRGRIGRRTP